MVAEVHREVEQLMNSESSLTEIVLDFSATELIDSNGIGTIIMLTRELETRGINFRLRNLNEDMLQFFKDTGLDSVFTIELEKTVVPAAIRLFEPTVDIKMQIGKEFSNDYAIFHLSGTMNHPVESSYFKQQFLLLLTRCNKLILDMQNLEFIDSLSISSILSMNNLLTGTGGKLLICNPNFFVHDLLDTLSIDAIIPIFSSLEEACAYWDKKDG
jgi:anti-anti-sigma factor